MKFSCPECGKELPLTSFSVDGNNKVRGLAECKHCVSDTSATWKFVYSMENGFEKIERY